MAGPIAEAFVNVRADTKGFQGEVTRGVTGAFRGLGRTVVGLATTYGLGQIFQNSITSASDLAESLNAVQVSYADLGAGAVTQLENMGAAAAENMGLTQTQFNESAVRFNAFSRAIADASGGDVISTLEEITGRATDFASVMNLDVVEAQRLFQSGLAGETEPLRRFGIDISAAAVETYALSEGIAGTYQELSEAEKQMIRWQLILDQTNQMEGDFTNTSHMLANALRIAKAQVSELGMSFGAGLLPGLQTAVNGFNEFLPSLNDSFTALGESVGNSLLPLFEAIGPALGTAIGHMAPIIDNIGRMFGAIAPIVEPIIDVIGSLAVVFSDVLAGAFVAFTPVFETVGFLMSSFASFLQSSSVQTLITQLGFAFAQVGTAISDGLLAVMPIIMELFSALLPIIMPLVGAFSDLFADVLAGILPVIISLFEQLSPVILEIAEVLSGALLEALPELAEAFITIFTAIEPLIPLLVDGLLIVLRNLEPILPVLIKGFIAFKIAFAGLSAIMAVNPFVLAVTALAALAVGVKMAYDRFEGFRNLVDGAWQTIQVAFDRIKEAIGTAMTAVMGFFETSGILDAFLDTVGGVFDSLKEIASGVITFFKSVFAGEWGAAWDAIKGIVSSWLDGVGSIFEGITRIGSIILGYLRQIDWGMIGSSILSFLSDAASLAWSGLQSVASWFGDLFGKFTAWIGEVDWRAVGQTIVNALALGAATAWSAIRSVAPWFGGFFDKVKAWVTGVDWGSIGGTILSALALGVATAFQGIGSVASWFGDMVTKLADWISSVNWDEVGTQIGDWVGQLPGKLIGWIADAFSGGGEGGGGGDGGTQWTEVATTLLNGLGEAIFALGVTLPAAIIEALAELALGIMTSLGEQLVEGLTGDNPVADFFKELPGNFVDWIGDMTDAGLRIAGNFLLSIVQGLQELSTRGGVGGFVAEIFGDLLHLDQLEEAIRPGARAVREAFNDAFSSHEEGLEVSRVIQQLYSQALPAINEVGREAGTMFTDAIVAALEDGKITADELVDLEQLANDLISGATVAGEETAAGFASGAGEFDMSVFTEEWNRKIQGGFKKNLYPTFNNAPAEFSREVSQKAPTALTAGGKQLITGLKSGIDNALVNIRVQMIGMSLQFASWLGNLSRVFYVAGVNLMAGLRLGIIIGLASTAITVRGIAGTLRTAIGSLSSTLYSAGYSLIQGLRFGINVGIIGLIGTMAGVRRAVSGGIGDLSGVLYNSGRQLMQGFINGMRSQAWAISLTVAALTNARKSIFKFHEGGIVPGNPNQEVLAVLQGGERVQTREQQQEADKSVSFGPGSVQVQFAGAMPTKEQAYMVGSQVGRGIEAELNRSRIRGLARTAG